MRLSDIKEQHEEDHELPKGYTWVNRAKALVDVDGDVTINSMEAANYIYHYVTGDFRYTRGYYNMKELGVPKGIGGDFDFSGNHAIKNLQGCPEEVDGNFYVTDCKLLTDISQVLNTKISGSFYCDHCPLSYESWMLLIDIQAKEVGISEIADPIIMKFLRTKDKLGYQEALLDAGLI